MLLTMLCLMSLTIHHTSCLFLRCNRLGRMDILFFFFNSSASLRPPVSTRAFSSLALLTDVIIPTFLVLFLSLAFRRFRASIASASLSHLREQINYPTTTSRSTYSADLFEFTG
ncbi:hypothetical protein VTL71DRAFT_5308 [Oculimacula yallundae]|uniref:Uncharacterized protein n=1 Tax=Oculimacula yallundae TaxID=86028 RepID=A0ABR4C385_9HELO